MESSTKSPKHPSVALPTEIWLNILSKLDQIDHPSLKNVAMISHRMYEMAAPTLFRTLKLEFGLPPRCSRCVENRPFPTRFCRYVRSIIIMGPGWQKYCRGDPFNELREREVDLVCSLFELTARLQDFYWWHEKYMPGMILYRLYEHHPQANVHLASSKIVLCQKMHPKRTSAPQLSLIRSISARWYRGEYDCPIKPNSAANYPAHLKDIICRSSNLETLRLIKEGHWRMAPLRVSPFEERVEDEGESHHRGLITLQEGDVLPQIRNLYFQSMRFGPTQSVLWATQLQWQNLKFLSLIEIDWTHLLPKITGRFRDLDSLEISVPDPYLRFRTRGQFPPAYFEQMGLLQTFLGALPPLKTFMGYDLPQTSLAVLASHSSGSLQHLRFRGDLGDSSNIYGRAIPASGPRFSASIEDFANLPDHFPKLQSLGFSIDWTSEEGLVLPHDILPNLSRLANLNHLELNHRDGYLAADDSTPWPYTNLTEASCRALTQSLDAMNTELLSLDIVIGRWFPSMCSKGFNGTWNGLEAFITGERDQAGWMQFKKFRQFFPDEELEYVGTLPSRVSPRSLMGDWSDDLRLNIESRMTRLFHERFKE